ncbi:hypothetical protein GCM10023322_11500 [Rugosimonospora acidiphila]|uniref:Uncharacterized protein n=1 Tax=Rugosimonospora acidiphila TaxID=556531 RepID=A0ABP9RLD0_9ACTN
MSPESEPAEPSLSDAKVGEVVTDGRDGGFFGVVDAKTGEDIEGVLPVCAGLFRLAQRQVGAGEPVMGAGLVVGLAQFGGEHQRLVVMGEGGLRVTGCVL